MNILTPKLVHEILTRFFPEKNDDFECDYVEELQELNDFGITTEEQLVNLLQKRTEEVIEIDESPMTAYEIRMHAEFDDEESVAKRLRENYWFSDPGLLRIALELEFGKAYEEYAERRDGIA